MRSQMCAPLPLQLLVVVQQQKHKPCEIAEGRKKDRKRWTRKNKEARAWRRAISCCPGTPMLILSLSRVLANTKVRSVLLEAHLSKSDSELFGFGVVSALRVFGIVSRPFYSSHTCPIPSFTGSFQLSEAPKHIALVRDRE